MGVLTGGRDADAAVPVIVLITKEVDEGLELALWPLHIIQQHIVVGGRNSAIASFMADKEEIVPTCMSNDSINDSSRDWVTPVVEQTCADAFF